MPAPDPDLAAFARSGCADAFRRLVERHVDAVHSTASRLLWGWPADAADVTQSVFILLARKAPRLSPDLVVGAWLHRQTVRQALNARRTETRRAARERTAADLLAMNDTASHDPAAALRPHIDAAILALPERERVLQRAVTPVARRAETGFPHLPTGSTIKWGGCAVPGVAPE